MKFFIFLGIVYFGIFSAMAQENSELKSSIQFSKYQGEVSLGSIKHIENFPSKYVKARNVDIWLPNNYNTSKKYAVLYMHDGQMLFDAKTTWNKQEWKVDETTSELLKEHKIKDCIIVGIWNIPNLRHSDYFPQKPFETLPKKVKDSLLNITFYNQKLFGNGIQSDNYLKFITKELKPFIDSHFSTYTNRENTFIAGSSMGGLISMYAICEYPKVFGGAACMSTHWIGTMVNNKKNPFPDAFFSYLEKNLPSPITHKIYFDYGTKTLDAEYLPYQHRVDEILKSKGYTSENSKNLKFEGQNHSENSWSERFQIPLQFLLNKN